MAGFRSAILPFANLGPEPEADEYLVDGMHDEILTRLSQVAALRVIFRASVMQFRGPSAPHARTVARALHADHP